MKKTYDIKLFTRTEAGCALLLDFLHDCLDPYPYCKIISMVIGKSKSNWPYWALYLIVEGEEDAIRRVKELEKNYVLANPGVIQYIDGNRN